MGRGTRHKKELGGDKADKPKKAVTKPTVLQFLDPDNLFSMSNTIPLKFLGENKEALRALMDNHFEKFSSSFILKFLNQPAALDTLDQEQLLKLVQVKGVLEGLSKRQIVDLLKKDDNSTELGQVLEDTSRFKEISFGDLVWELKEPSDVPYKFKTPKRKACDIFDKTVEAPVEETSNIKYINDSLELKISDTELSLANIKQIASLSWERTIKSISFENCSLDAQNFNGVVSAFMLSADLEKLDFKNVNLINLIDPVMQLACGNSSVKEIIFENCKLQTKEILEILIRVAEYKNKHIEIIDFRGYKIEDGDKLTEMKEIMTLLLDMQPQLTQISFYNLTADKEITTGVVNFYTLEGEKIRVIDTLLPGDEVNLNNSIDPVMQIACSNLSVKEIIFENCNFQIHDILSILSYVFRYQNKHIEVIDFRGYKIEDRDKFTEIKHVMTKLLDTQPQLTQISFQNLTADKEITTGDVNFYTLEGEIITLIDTIASAASDFYDEGAMPGDIACINDYGS